MHHTYEEVPFPLCAHIMQTETELHWQVQVGGKSAQKKKERQKRHFDTLQLKAFESSLETEPHPMNPKIADFG